MADETPPTGQQYNPNYNPKSIGPGNVPFTPAPNKITPAPGWMIDPNNPQGVIPIGSAPTPQTAVPGAPGSPQLMTETPNYGGAPTSSVASTTSSVASVTPQISSVASAVAQTTPTQETGQTPTIPQILASLGQSASQYGTAQVNPAQNSQLATAYNGYFANTSGTAPNQSPTGDINQAIESSANPDPQQQYFDTYSSLNPIVAQIYNEAQTILSPQNSTQTFTQQYQTLTAQAGIPALQTQLMNIQNVMNGTENDIRNEITASGGFATESQVQALSAARNQTLSIQATALSNLLNTQQQYVQNVMQYSEADQTQVNTEVNTKTGLLEQMATLQDTMNKAATANYQSIVNNLGYTGLAQMFQGNPQGAAQAESLLGLNPGSLTNATWLQNAATLRQLNAQNAATKTTIELYNAGLGTGGGSSTGTTDTPATAQAPNFETISGGQEYVAPDGTVTNTAAVPPAQQTFAQSTSFTSLPSNTQAQIKDFPSFNGMVYVTPTQLTGMTAGQKNQLTSNVLPSLGIPTVSAKDADALDSINVAQTNLQDFYNFMQTAGDGGKPVLPLDSNGQPQQYADVELNDYLQTNNQLGAYNTWKLGAIQLLGALKGTTSGGGGGAARLFTTIGDLLPVDTDTLPTAASKIAHINDMLSNAGYSITGTPTNNLDGGSGTTMMTGPDGNSYQVPADQVNAFRDAGGY